MRYFLFSLPQRWLYNQNGQLDHMFLPLGHSNLFNGNHMPKTRLSIPKDLICEPWFGGELGSGRDGHIFFWMINYIENTS